jgi:hypothetical protein
MFDDAARDAIGLIARDLGVEEAALLAVAEVESAGKPFAEVDGKPMPLIRWECHYFFKLLPEKLRAQAVDAKLAHPKAAAVPNPGKQQARYDLLARAKEIDESAALSSCSWGLGQVMGSHWKWLGYSSPQELVNVACSGIPGQVQLMARFIKKNNLVDELQRKDWASFARAYNGSSFKVNRYDEKMAQAYARYRASAPAQASATTAAPASPPAAPETETMLRLGSSGPEIGELQQMLRRAGYFLHIDSEFGIATRKAVMDFQRDQGLDVDGVVGLQTWAVLERLQGVDPQALVGEEEPA